MVTVKVRDWSYRLGLGLGQFSAVVFFGVGRSISSGPMFYIPCSAAVGRLTCGRSGQRCWDRGSRSTPGRSGRGCSMMLDSWQVLCNVVYLCVPVTQQDDLVLRPDFQNFLIFSALLKWTHCNPTHQKPKNLDPTHGRLCVTCGVTAERVVFQRRAGLLHGERAHHDVDYQHQRQVPSRRE